MLSVSLLYGNKLLKLGDFVIISQFLLRYYPSSIDSTKKVQDSYVKPRLQIIKKNRISVGKTKEKVGQKLE